MNIEHKQAAEVAAKVSQAAAQVSAKAASVAAKEEGKALKDKVADKVGDIKIGRAHV